tara:strand:- start:475 stop:984 length:510 start_codon:yes stop_codon:yes gene_type:complete
MDLKSTISFYGERPFWQKMVAAAFYTGAIICLYNSFFEPPAPNRPNNPGNVMTWIMISYICVLVGLLFSKVRDFHFDFASKRYKIVNRIGLFGIGRWKNFKSIDYVSVFLREDYHYQVKIWYNKNKDLVVAGFYTFNEAMDFGRELAMELKIDLLDAATNPRDSKWIDL